MRTRTLAGWLLLTLLTGLLSTSTYAGTPTPPPADAIAQAVEVTGEALFASNQNQLLDYERARRYEGRAASDRLRLAQGQWLRAGDAVMALENASVLLRWRDGAEQRLGPRTMPVSTTIHPLPATPAVSPTQPRDTDSPLRAFERAHRPALLFVLGAGLALLPLLRRRSYRPGTVARLVAAALLVGVTLPVALMLFALQLGRLAWYQPPTPGIAWTGIAATLAHVANVVAACVVFAGVLALFVLGIALVRGGEVLARRSRTGWWLALGAVSIAAVAYLAPYAPMLDYASSWYGFWHGWARFYAVGAWLLLPFAHLLACATARADHRLDWRHAAPSTLLVLFAGCVAIGYGADYDPAVGARASEPASRAEARRWLCAAPHVFEGTTDEVRIVPAAGCDATPSRRAGDLSGTLQACEAAMVSVRIDTVLRSPNLQPGQVVDFAVAHARQPLDGDGGLVHALRGRRLLFQTRDERIDGRAVQVSAARPGRNRSAPLGFSNEGDDAYARDVLAECVR